MRKMTLLGRRIIHTLSAKTAVPGRGRRSLLPSSLEGTGDCESVRVLEVAAGRQSLRKPGQRAVPALQQLPEIIRSRLSFHIGALGLAALTLPIADGVSAV